MHLFEVRYLNIVWSDSETVIKLTSCHEALELERMSFGWQVETTAFPKIHHYIGICVKDDCIKHIPFFKLAADAREELMPIKAPGSDDIWWIQNSGWDKKNKRYYSELYRTVGRATLVIQGHLLVIENNISNFTTDELEYYLSDFKNNLWMLILDDSSVSKASINRDVPNCFNDNVVKLFHEFIESVESIKKQPGMILAESQGKVPIKHVRPVPRTFREYATQPNAKFLTSRTFFKSYDTSENRFIHYCLKRVLYILKSLSSVANAQKDAYARRIEQEHLWREQLHKTNTKQIDPIVYDNEILKLEGDLSAIEKELSALTLCPMHDEETQRNLGPSTKKFGSITVLIGSNYGNSSRHFFVQLINGSVPQDEFGTYLTIEFPECQDFSAHKSSLYNGELVIQGHYIKSKKTSSKGKVYLHLQLCEIKTIFLKQHPIKRELTRLIDKKKQLERNDWIEPLTFEEKKDRAMESQVVMTKVKAYEDLQQKISKFSSSLPTLISRVNKVASFFIKNNVKTRADCPNTMVFIQNPDYASTKSNFKKISALKGLDESMLNSLMAVDEIGLVNVANLYEKWCLLQIIKVLNQVFGFFMEPGWQRTVVDAVLKKEYNIEIKFKAPERRQRIVLTYEKELFENIMNSRRPDFVIDLYSEDSDSIDSPYMIPPRQSRLVLDAKFRGQMNEGQLLELVMGLVTGKDYSENATNQVFVIHPSPNVIANRTSPLNWGSFCDYGQSHEHNHRYGSIFVSPSLTHFRSIDHLQRLVGMFLQENSFIENNEDGSVSRNCVSCVSCGNSNREKLQLRYEPTKAKSDRWIISCVSCGLLTVETICKACHRSIFKNGPKWTYHRTRAEQTSNVVCPNCEEFL